MTRKIADLLHNMSDGTYTDLVDEIASKADKQLADYYNAEQQVKKKGKSAQKIRKNIHKKMIQNSGAVHQTIKKLHEPHSLADIARQQALEDQHYQELTSQLIEILFPTRTYTVLNEGKKETIKVDGLAELVKQIEWHPEFQTFFSEFKEHMISALPDSTHRHIATLEKAIVPIIQKFAVQSAKSFLSKKLSELLKNGIESGLKANAMDRALAENILPPTIKAILPIFIGMILEKETKMSTEELNKLFQSSDLEKTRQEIGQKFYGLIKNAKQNATSDYKNTGGQFSWDLLNIDEPKFIKSYLNETINETIKNCILKSMFEKENADSYHKIVKLFKKWVEKNDPAAEEKIYRQIFELTKKKGIKIEWPEEKEKRSQSPFFIYMGHFVNNIKGAIEAVSLSPSHEEIPLKEEEIKNIIRQQIQPFKEEEEISPYYKLLLNFLTIGENDWTANNIIQIQYIKGKIDTKLVSAMQCVRLSHRKILHGILNGMQTSLTNQKIRQMVKPEPVLESREEQEDSLNQAKDIQDKLDNNMETLSRLLYDFIYFSLPPGVGYGFQRLEGPDYKDLKLVVEKFKEKIVDDPLMKKNFVFNVAEEFVNALKEASRPVPPEKLIA